MCKGRRSSCLIPDPSCRQSQPCLQPRATRSMPTRRLNRQPRSQWSTPIRCLPEILDPWTDHGPGRNRRTPKTPRPRSSWTRRRQRPRRHGLRSRQLDRSPCRRHRHPWCPLLRLARRRRPSPPSCLPRLCAPCICSTNCCMTASSSPGIDPTGHRARRGPGRLFGLWPSTRHITMGQLFSNTVRIDQTRRPGGSHG